MNINLNFKQVFKYLIPTALRGEKHTDWLGALLAPLQSLNVIFAAKVVAIRHLIAYNSQVMYLERRLNNDFDNTLRRIYIDDPGGTFTVFYHIWNAPEAQPIRYVYNAAELQPTQLYLYPAAQYNISTDFTVYVPTGLLPTSQSQLEVRNTVNKYRHAGKRFTFATY